VPEGDRVPPASVFYLEDAVSFLQAFIREEYGQDGVEYALLIGFVSCVVIGGAVTFTADFNTFWSDLGGAITKGGKKLSGL
jgi:Flp pilus assembly pilin Flp